jgi:transposase
VCWLCPTAAGSAGVARASRQADRRARGRAAPFRKQDEPAGEPKQPGRKRGRRHGPHAHREAIPPERIDEHYDVPLPARCPHCDSRQIEETRVVTQYQTEIPREPIHRQFDIHIGECRDRGRTIRPRHEPQTSDAIGAAASQLGPRAHAAMAMLNKQLGPPHGKSARLFSELFGIQIARATSARSIVRTSRRGGQAYEALRRDIRGSPFVVPDETGWRVGGKNAWLHVFTSGRATCYVIDPTRSHEPGEQLLGLDWPSTLVHDGWSVYDRFTSAAHQQCVGHLQRRCEQLLETSSGGAPTATPGAISASPTSTATWSATSSRRPTDSNGPPLPEYRGEGSVRHMRTRTWAWPPALLG